MRSQTTRVIGGRVNLDGTVAVPGPFTARRTATGDYTLTFTDRLLSVSGADSSGGNNTATTAAYTGNSCRMVLQAVAGGLVDRPFVFTAVVVA